MRKSSFYFISILLLLAITNCNRVRKSKNSMQIEKNNIQIGGIERLKGANLIIEDNEQPFAFKSSIQNTSSSAEINFGSNGRISIEVQNEILLLSATYENTQNTDGCKYIGISFDEISNFKIGNAFYKYGSVKAWTHPTKITKADDLQDADIQFFLWQYQDGTYGAMMPLMGKGHVSTLGKINGKPGVKSYSLVTSTNPQNIPMVAIAFGSNPYKMIESLYEEGMKYMGKEAGLRKNKPYPEFFTKLMWCTWNSFGHGLDEQKVFAAMEDFKSKGVTFPLVLLDDGWSKVSAYGKGMLQSFKPDTTKFPKGLKPVVEKLKLEYGVKEVGVWHAYSGYWAGIDPKSDLGKSFGSDLMAYRDKVAWSGLPIDTFYFINPFSKSGYEFYNQWHSYLKNEGISFLKVDNQLVMDRMAKGNYPFADFAEKMQYNLQTSVKNNFDGRVINCMDMTTDAVYNYGSSALGRASEDFFPENESYKITAGNAAVHVLCNAYNSLWWGQMVWPDFDMFQTHHPQAEYHAVARAVSGGPIYFADSIGKTDPTILKKLSLEDGTILRADKPAMPTKDCLFNIQDAKPLKIFSTANETGLLAVFNAADADTVEGSFSVTDIEGFEKGDFAVYDYKKAEIQSANTQKKFDLSLPRLEWQLYYIKPIKNQFAAFGIVNKYNAPKTIKSKKNTGYSISIELAETQGTFVAYSGKQPKKVLNKSGSELKFSFEKNMLKVDLIEKADAMLEIIY